jgi:DNA-binding beta-propeller fold protein YncE
MPTPTRRLRRLACLGTIAAALLPPLVARAEILAVLNYESKAGQPERREGLAIIDIDPNSPTFDTIVKDAPLPPDFVAHHIYYNTDVTKAYVTSLGHSELYVYDLAKFPDEKKIVSVPDCKVGEDVAFSRDGARWYLSCMGSSNIIVGDARADRPIGVIAASDPGKPFIKYPHGLTLNDDLDRLFATSTANPNDLSDAGETVTIIEASTQKVLSTHKLSDKPSPSKEAPVETAFIPGRDPQIAYITNMFGAALWTATWRPQSKDFDFRRVFDFAQTGQGVALEMDFDDKGERLYVTTAKPGAFHIFDIADPYAPKLLTSIPTAGGAHHFVFSPDDRYVFVQNSLLNLPEMNDGSVTVIDMAQKRVVAEVNVLKKAGLTPNCIIMMPKWHRSE